MNTQKNRLCAGHVKFWPSQISSATLNPLFIIYTSKEHKYCGHWDTHEKWGVSAVYLEWYYLLFLLEKKKRNLSVSFYSVCCCKICELSASGSTYYTGWNWQISWKTHTYTSSSNLHMHINCLLNFYSVIWTLQWNAWQIRLNNTTVWKVVVCFLKYSVQAIYNISRQLGIIRLIVSRKVRTSMQ